MTNDALDPAKAHGVIFKPETEYVSQRFAGQLVHAATGRIRCKRLVDKITDTDHAHAALIVANEDMLVSVYTHDDDAVIPQLVDIEVIAADAATQRRDERADFRRRQHLVEARLLDVED